jgi:protein involved in polysaccharide export with SLBB domain
MRFFRFLIACCMLSPLAMAQTTTEPDTGSSSGTFVVPGYTTPSTPQRGGAPGPQSLPGARRPGEVPSTVLRTPGAVQARPGEEAGAQRRAEPLQPPKPSEFQKFVETATGRLLPMFGSSFFADPTSVQDPLNNVPVAGDYVIGPGDELIVRAWGSIDADMRATVDRNGQINLPKVGSFNVAGVRASDLERHLRAQIGRVYTNFNLNVTLGQLRGLKVFVVGPAQRPGVYTLASQSTILSAVAAAGGPGPNGSMRKVGLRRDGKLIAELDVYEFLVQGDKSNDLQLAAGDVIVFGPVGPRVALTGALETPAIFELKSQEEPMREVLRYAGGVPVLANPNRAQLERIDATQRAARFVEEFKLDANGLQKPLRDGDIVTLLEISPQFANAVTLRGHVAQPLRYPYTPGMRVSDLIPDREALISPDFYRRKNLLVQVIDEGEQELRRDPPLIQRGPQRQMQGQQQPQQQQQQTGTTPAQPQVPGLGTAAANGTTGSVAAAPQPPAGTPSAAQPLDAETQMLLYSRRARREVLDEEQERIAAQRPPKPPTPLFDELNWDYAQIERLDRNTLTSKVIPFNLGRAVVEHDPADNLELMAGDVVTVYSVKDMRVPVAKLTRLVSVEGEVNAPGVYQLQPGETLRHLIARVGGFTEQAYVYGLEFSREETKKKQRENLSAAVTRLTALAATQTARDAANRRDDPNDRSATVSNAATQAQLARLAQLQPNGRIALELQPDTHTVDALPDVPLEQGDRIIVPPRPGFVTVAGAVVNNNAFLWKPGRTAGDYVRLAGLDEAADASSMFILRADGTVVSGNDKRGFFSFGSIEKQSLQPGDAVVVPSQLDYETWGKVLVRNLKDWSQIFYQFGLGAAAIETLRQATK